MEIPGNFDKLFSGASKSKKAGQCLGEIMSLVRG